MQRKRILFFAQDGLGLGHLRRLCRIAESLQGEYSTLVVSGKREVSWMASNRCEYIHVPSWKSLGMGPHANPRHVWLDVQPEAGIRMVRTLFESIERAFSPDFILVDHTLSGQYGVLHEMLIASKAQVYMIMRGITDDEDAKRFEQHDAAILGAFDKVLVACDEKTSDFRPEDSRVLSFVPKTQHVGYVLPAKPDIAKVRSDQGVDPKRQWVVCSAGGGIHAEDRFRNCVAVAESFPEAFFDVVLGPYSCLDPLAIGRADNLRVRTIVEELPAMHAACDVAVINGGYNSLFEVISGGGRMLVYPNQADHAGDQFVHAKRLQEYYPITIVSSTQELLASLDHEIAAARSGPRAIFGLETNGLENIKRVLDNASTA